MIGTCGPGKITSISLIMVVNGNIYDKIFSSKMLEMSVDHKQHLLANYHRKLYDTVNGIVMVHEYIVVTMIPVPAISLQYKSYTCSDIPYKDNIKLLSW